LRRSLGPLPQDGEPVAVLVGVDLALGEALGENRFAAAPRRTEPAATADGPHDEEDDRGPEQQRNEEPPAGAVAPVVDGEDGSVCVHAVIVGNPPAALVNPPWVLALPPYAAAGGATASRGGRGRT